MGGTAMKYLLILILFGLVSSVVSVEAIMVNSVNADALTPGSEGTVHITLENTLDETIKDVSLNLIFEDTTFTPVGSSEKSVDEIDDNDEERFTFRLRADNNIKPGNYEIPYILTYKEKGSSIFITSKGTFGLQVTGSPDLAFSLQINNPVENQPGKITLKIVNKGFSEARFASARVVSSDFVLLSEQEKYIGTIDSDDFETAEFNVLFDRNPANFKAIVDYKDFDNQDRSRMVNLPLTIYSENEALRLGIIQHNRSWLFFLAIVLIVIGIVVARKVKKNRRLKRSLRQPVN